MLIFMFLIQQILSNGWKESKQKYVHDLNDDQLFRRVKWTSNEVTYPSFELMATQVTNKHKENT